MYRHKDGIIFVEKITLDATMEVILEKTKQNDMLAHFDFQAACFSNTVI
jgi:hypothetical protein